MIKIDVQPYCQDCQVFEADVANAHKTINDDGEFDLTDTIVQCRRRNLCAGLVKHFRKQFQKGE